MKRILLPALALSAMSSAALAEPMSLTDAQMDAVTAAGFAFVDASKFVYIDEYINKYVDIYKDKYIQQRVDVQGFFAEADGGANCRGYGGCEALTYAITDVSDYGGVVADPSGDSYFDPRGYATSVSGSEAATGYDPYYNNNVE